MNEERRNNSFNMAQDKQNLHQCKECGLHYKDKDTSEKCETWCKEHKTCNVEITREAEENIKDDKPFDFAQGKLKELELKCEEYLNNWKRSAADFINYKKDEMDRMGILVKYAKEDVILKILPILDSFELAEKHSNILENVGMSEWLKGFEQIKKQVEEFLKKEGIEEIETAGKPFNPETMEVIEEVLASADLSAEASAQAGVMAGTVAEELQKGYMIGDKVLRPAKVKVTK